ncbi:MAG: glycosyltransferase family 2 protein, partial [Candidatus Jordarchaeaceae archaeon]
GSFDKTVEVAKQYDVKIINGKENRGKGDALKKGFLNCKGDLVVTMDADGSHRPEDIPLLVTTVLKDDIDAVIGSRFANGIEKNLTSRLHIVGNKIINTIIFLLTGRHVSDSQSGFRVYKRDAVKRLSLSSSRYEIESELTVKMLRNGFKIKEIPIKSLPRGNGRSKINEIEDGIRILKSILKATFCN